MTSMVLLPWVGWVTVCLNLGRACRSGARGSEFLSAPRMTAALGYLARRACVVETR